MSYVESLEMDRERAAGLAEAHSLHYLHNLNTLSKEDKEMVMEGIKFYNHQVGVLTQQIDWERRNDTPKPWTYPKEPAWSN